MRILKTIVHDAMPLYGSGRIQSESISRDDVLCSILPFLHYEGNAGEQTLRLSDIRFMMAGRVEKVDKVLHGKTEAFEVPLQSPGRLVRAERGGFEPPIECYPYNGLVRPDIRRDEISIPLCGIGQTAVYIPLAN